MTRRHALAISTAPRGITASDVDRAADALLRDGERPTIEKVRHHIGRGSPNTINPLLDQWWSRLAGRLDAGPAALHRLPEPVAHAAEGLWLQALEEARRRAQLERGSAKAALDRERQDLVVQRHVLSLREAELKNRIDQAEHRTRALELELATITTLLRKEQASREAAERRARDAQARLDQPRRARPRTRPAGARTPTTARKSPPKRTTMPARPRNRVASPAKSRKPAKKSARPTAPARRKVTATRSRRR
jgi:hypothetical protein